jgi:hypothetical protein
MSFNGHRCTSEAVICPDRLFSRRRSRAGERRYGDAVRWDWLFGDLEAQLEADDRAGFEAELGDLVRAERAAISLRDRLLAHVGCDVALHLVGGGEQARGAVLDVGADWVLLRSAAGDVLVPAGSVAAVAGLSRSAVSDGGRPARALRLNAVLRGLAGDRSPVTVELDGGVTLSGTIDRVGADHVDLAVHPLDEPRRQESVAGIRTLVTAAIVRITVV